MSNPTTPFSWQMPTATDLVTDLPADFEVFGQAVATSLADLLGGTTGQVLSKTTNADMDFTWTTANPGDITGVTAGTGISGGGTSGSVTITNDMATTITASGDIVVGTGSGTYDNLPIGTTGQILTADTTVSPYKVKWATPASSGGMTSLASGTLSGATLTLSSISQDYVHLQLILTDINVANAGDSVYARINNSSQTYYAAGGQTVAVNGTTPTLGTINKFDSLLNLTSFTAQSGNQANQAILNVYNYTAAGVYTMGEYQTVFVRNTGGNEATTKAFWSYNNSGIGAITRLDVFGDSTFSGGTYVLYGVK